MPPAWANVRARRSTKNRKLLADHPDAEINIASTNRNYRFVPDVDVSVTALVGRALGGCGDETGWCG
jgi:hypothetical protein